MEADNGTNTLWDDLIDLFKQSVIIQSLVTLILLGVVGYRVAIGAADTIPELWWQITVLVVGYWFGAKASFQAWQANRQSQEVMRETLHAMQEMSTTFVSTRSPGGDCAGGPCGPSSN